MLKADLPISNLLKEVLGTRTKEHYWLVREDTQFYVNRRLFSTPKFGKHITTLVFSVF